MHVLLDIADEIVENLDQGFSGECVHANQIERAETLMWLWLLGAYEIVRTMCQSKKCFTQQIFDELSQLKKRLAKVRMPAAKMEKPGSKSPVTSDRSPAGWNVACRGMIQIQLMSLLVSYLQNLIEFSHPSKPVIYSAATKTHIH